MEKRAGSRPRPEETVDLEGDDGPRVKSKGPRVLRKVGQQILRVEETDHGDASCDVDGIDVVPVDERTEMPATGHVAGRKIVMWLLLLAGEMISQSDGISSAHAGQRLPQVIAQYAAFRLGKSRDVIGSARDADAVGVEVDEPNVVGQFEMFLVLEECSRDADDVRRWGQQELFGAAHAGGQEWNDWEHVLERVEHRDEGQHGHGQGVVVARLHNDLVLEHDEREDLEAGVDAQELQRQMQREVDHRETGVVGQGEDQRRRLKGPWQNVQLHSRLARYGHRSAQQPEDPRLDVPHVVQDDGRGRLARLARQQTPNRIPNIKIIRPIKTDNTEVDRIPGSEAGGAQPLGRRIFVTCVN